MRTSLIAASVLLVGATAMAAPQAGTKAPAKPAAAKPAAMKTAHAAGTVEKFDAATHTLTVKEKGKEMQFVIGDSATPDARQGQDRRRRLVLGHRFDGQGGIHGDGFDEDGREDRAVGAGSEAGGEEEERVVSVQS